MHEGYLSAEEVEARHVGAESEQVSRQASCVHLRLPQAANVSWRPCIVLREAGRELVLEPVDSLEDTRVLLGNVVEGHVSVLGVVLVRLHFEPEVELQRVAASSPRMAGSCAAAALSHWCAGRRHNSARLQLSNEAFELSLRRFQSFDP